MHKSQEKKKSREEEESSGNHNSLLCLFFAFWFIFSLHSLFSSFYSLFLSASSFFFFLHITVPLFVETPPYSLTRPTRFFFSFVGLCTCFFDAFLFFFSIFCQFRRGSSFVFAAATILPWALCLWH